MLQGRFALSVFGSDVPIHELEFNVLALVYHCC